MRTAGAPASPLPGRAVAEYQSMAIFWIWGIRNPCVLLAGLVTASGLAGVADWSITLAVAMVLGVAAEAGSFFGRRAITRRDRDRAARDAIRGAAALRDRFREQDQLKRAA